MSKKSNSISSYSNLILWNDNQYAKYLQEIFDSDMVITSSKELEDLNFSEQIFSGAIVLIELHWENHVYTELYGIELVKNFLRARKKLKFPILFVSFLSLKQIMLDSEGNKQLENQIVGAIGHEFLRLPVMPQTLHSSFNQLSPLNELQFADVFNNLSNLKGLVGGRIHELQGQLRSLESTPDKFKEQAGGIFEKSLDEIKTLLKDTIVTNQIQQFKHEFQEKISNVNVLPKDIQEFLELCGNKISGLIIEEPGIVKVEESITKSFEKQPWKILLLDDEPDSLHTLQASLQQHGVEYYLAQTVEAAEKIISEDIYNEITVAISDYRLLEKKDEIEKHQRKQGYDFLFWLSTQNRFTRLIALSGLSRRFLLESFQKYNTRVDVYSKQDLTSGRAVNLFVDNLVDRGREIYDMVCSNPTVGDWKSLKPFYAAHRTSTNYRLKEQEINNRASQYIRQYEALLESRDETSLLKPDLDNLSDLTTRLAEKDPNDLRSMEAFYNKLVGRRVALWLHLKLGFSRNEVFASLKGELSPANILLEIENDLMSDIDKYDENLVAQLKVKTHKKYKDNSTNLVTTNLALSFPVAGHELLIEEKYWLKTEIGIRNFDSPFSLARQLPYLVQIGLEIFLGNLPFVAEKLKKSNKTFTHSGKFVLVGFEDAKEIIKSVAQAVSSEKEEDNFRQLLIVLNKNIQAYIRDNKLKREFLDFINEFSDFGDK